MRFNKLKTSLKTAVFATTILLLGASLAAAQVNLTAGPSSVTLPDGNTVPMWGYTCGTAVAGSTATCASLNPAAAATTWSPVVITVPTGQNLTINLTNSLAFAGGNIPTSLTIVGQLGGGLGTGATSTVSPDHSAAQSSVTWSTLGAPSVAGTPPLQANRVQSFSTEVATGATTALTWTAPRPGTYLIESGTHPSIQGPMGLIGILVVTAAPSAGVAGTAYPGVSYNSEIPLLMSEIDPAQNKAVDAAVRTVGFSETKVWSGLSGGCGNPASGAGVYQTCYPPVVNYSPLYYLFNGVAFNKTAAATSLFPSSVGTGVAPVAGNVLVRFVNAGLHMHVPSIVGAQTTPVFVPTSVTATPTSGLSLIAEDGNPLPGVTRVQSEVFMAPGKTYDVMINVPAAGGTALPVFDRELSLSGNASSRDAGMLAYISVNGAIVPASLSFTPAVARADVYNSVVSCTVAPCNTVNVSDPSKGVIANDTNVYGVTVMTPPTGAASFTLNPDGTFAYTPNAGVTSDSFSYCANGSVTAGVCSSNTSATVTLGACAAGCLQTAAGISVNSITYTSNVATSLNIKSPGILSVDADSMGYPLTVNAASVTPVAGLTLSVAPSGGFNASVAAPGTYTFSYKAQNSQGTVSATSATVTLVFPTGSGLSVNVVDGGDKVTAITDYRWIIEEDRTFYVDPNKTQNTSTTNGTTEPTFGVNFHTSFMPMIATGCTGTLSCETGQTVQGVPAVCNVGDGVCTTTAAAKTITLPGSVHLDPTKRYYISVLPGDAANPFIAAATLPCTPGVTPCGHGMGGAPIPFACPPGTTCSATPTFAPVTVLTQPTPFPPSQLSVFVFEDDFPLNGEVDAGGGALGGATDGLAANEPGLGHFNITMMDDAGGPGDPTGQMTYDMFNQPLANSLDGTVDPQTGQNACPITRQDNGGITGTIVTCPRFEADGVTFSPLAGQALVKNLMPGRYGIVATPGADRIAAGEEWLQTNTLDGQKAHDSFLRIGEPSYFQEFGPAGYHVSIGFANPKIINGRLPAVCAGTLISSAPAGTSCNNTVTGQISTERMSRTPDERLYGSGDYSSFAFSQCYVSMGDPDGADFAFTKCDQNGKFTLTGVPDGQWRITVFDQWNDMLVDGLSTPVGLAGGATGGITNIGEIGTNQWQANFITSTFFDDNGDGVRNPGEAGLALVKTNVRFRDGSFSNRNNTDLNGVAAFNEEFPLFSWYVLETDNTRYKNTGTHIVYDSGGPADGSVACGTAGYPPCGTSTFASHLANTAELWSVPTALRVPGAVYCATADCAGASIATPASSAPPSVCTVSATGVTTCTTQLSTGRIDPPWVETEAWQGFSGQNNFLEFGKKPYAVGETGGIHGHVVYSSTRPFDDPQFNTQNVWEPLVPNVTINLYKEGTAPDGSTSLTLVDTTKTSSWDDWAQGFRTDGVPNMNCPGQSTADLFYFTLYNQPSYLDVYNNGGTPAHTLPNNSQFKCYDGLHAFNQLQPAPYDGMYNFPSVTGINPTTGHTTGTNCTICLKNTDATDLFRFGKEDMLPKGKYVVEVVVPPGYELVKEEDKNILIGDQYIAPVIQEFGGLGNVFILPDQAEIAAGNVQQPTLSLGRNQQLTSHEGDTPTVDTFWPCVGEQRIVPDFISLFPASNQVAPFAGATRNLCDRKLVTLDDQTSAQAEFFVYTDTHAAAHFTGVITDDFTSEFDPFSPQFGEKFSPPNLPVSIKDWTGAEINRVYADQWGSYDGMTYSTWEVNPPNPTGYAPTMMVTCMNDPGTGATPDKLFNPEYSNFCYEIPFMPGATQYMDTPVTPTSAFAGAGYNNPDCAYPDATPAIKEVDGDGIGPWVSKTGVRQITITALGDQLVPNNGYSGPQTTTTPFNQQTVLRHYNFGSTPGTVTVGGVALTNVAWSPTSITGTVPLTVPACAVQQQTIYGGPAASDPALCGQLVITAANGQQSIDAITVTVGGKAPTHVAAAATIQAAVDAANPGDMIIIDPTCSTAAGPVSCTTPAATKANANHVEFVLMWKPLRLQGVGGATSIINANTHPAGRLDPWRRQVDCLFGLALNGTPAVGTPGATAGNLYDPTGKFTCSSSMQFSVDRLPLEATVGWDASLNGNLAEQLQEPSLMGAYEGAGITVLAKGVKFPAGSAPFGSDIFPVGTTLLTQRDCLNRAGTNPFPSNFQCNPSSIDGIGISNSSQGGGGIFVHAWAHNLQIANNRITNNSGTLAGGIAVGQGENPEQYLKNPATPNPDPGSCQNNGDTGTQLPYCHNLNVNLHNNMISLNSSLGDELFSSTPSGAGGVVLCAGADYYKFNYNWVCGNLSSGDGGGVAHMGFIYNGDMEHNQFLFNQSTNPTVPTNGGGLAVLGAPDTDPVCGVEPDQDCPPGTSDGTGPGLVINANLFMGNSAESGSGGAIRMHGINGTEVTFFPTQPGHWYAPQITNNIIVNNVAGWDGAGISLQDAVQTNIINNTIMSNDTTASAGILFNTLGAPLSTSPGTNCVQAGSTTTTCPQPAGVVATRHSPTFQTNIGGLPVIATGRNAGHRLNCTADRPNCDLISNPNLFNNILWQNRSYYIGVGSLSNQYQQNILTLYNSFGTTPAISQPQAAATTANGGGVIITGGTGACTPASYWDIGVRGDTGPANHSSGFTLTPIYNVLTDAVDYPGAHNQAVNPAVAQQYCNGSRVPPELGSAGWAVPPGIADATVPNPAFTLLPAATVDEGNNWVNMSWGPLALVNPVTNAVLGKYVPASGTSPTVDFIPASAGPAYNQAPSTDYFGAPRKVDGFVDAGAVEFSGTAAPPAVTLRAATTAAFNPVAPGVTTANAQTLDFLLSNAGPGTFTITAATVGNAPFSRTGAGTFPATAPNCGGALAAGATCTIRGRFQPTVGGTFTGAVTVTGTTAGGVADLVTGSPLTITGTAIQGALTFTLGAHSTGVTFGPILGVNVLNFGTQANAPAAAASATLTLTNSGTAPVVFSAVPGDTVTGARYAKAADTCQGTTVAVGGSCSITVSFSPNSAVIRLGLLTVRDNAVGNPQFVVLSGN
jgi:hypothetical protein